MIVPRRLLAIALLPILLLLLFVTLIVHELNDSLFRPGFYVEQLRDGEVYRRLHDDVLPAALEEFLAHQDEELPDKLSSIELPSDSASRERMLAFFRLLLPAEEVQETVEHVLGEFLPYLFGESDEFEFNVSLFDAVQRGFAHEPGEPSEFERAYRDIDIGHRAIDGLVLDSLDGESALHLTDMERESLIQETLGDADLAISWFDEQLFWVIDQIRPWLVGERDTFEVIVRFDAYPGLVVPLAGPLERSPIILLRDGYQLSERDIRAELAAAQSDAINDVERSLAVFSAEGWSYDERALIGDIADTNREDETETRPADVVAEADDRAGLDVDGVRAAARLVRQALRWGLTAAVAAMVLLIGLLGGRNWFSRLMWGMGSLAAAALAIVAVAGSAGYAPRLTPRLHELLLDETEGWSGSRAAFRELLVERGTAIADAFAAGVALRAGATAAVAVIILACALWLSSRDRSTRRERSGAAG